MRIEALTLSDFRNISALSLEWDKGTNLLWGNNAQGKTNILEALYLCGTTKSHRGAKDKDMIRVGCDEAHIRMLVSKKDNDIRIDMHLKKNKAKGIAINGQRVTRASELYGLVSMVFFSPEDLDMIKRGPSERRSFIDRELSQLDAIYLSDLTRYQKCLQQRNKLLHEIAFRPDLIHELDVWDEQLVFYGQKVIAKRGDFIRELTETVRRIHTSLTGGKEEIRLIYEPSVSAEGLGDRIQKGRETDLRFQATQAGPHRDDMGVMLGQMDCRLYGSQGQQRTSALSLKLSEIDLIRTKRHDDPILLLDDVLSELDETRQDYLLSGISQTQTMITCTGFGDISRSNFKINKAFHIVSGGIA